MPDRFEGPINSTCASSPDPSFPSIFFVDHPLRALSHPPAGLCMRSRPISPDKHILLRPYLTEERRNLGKFSKRKRERREREIRYKVSYLKLALDFYYIIIRNEIFAVEIE